MIALNSFYFSPYEFGLDLFGLLCFGLGSFVVIFILNLYYNKIPKSNNSISELTNPIYQTKDILLQSSSNDVNFIITQSSTLTLVKILVFVLIAFVVFIPVDQLLGIVNSIY